MGGLSNSATTQTQIQNFQLTHLNINSIYKLLEHMKGLVELIILGGEQKSQAMKWRLLTLNRSLCEPEVIDYF